MFKIKLLLSILLGVNAVASIAADVSIPRASEEQAKVIVYRGNTNYYAPMQSAHVYVNDIYVNSLERNEYTEFCLNPNYVNKFTSHLQDAFIYSEKNKNHFSIPLLAGNTYFLRLADDQGEHGELVPEDRLNAEKDLSNKKQKNTSSNSVQKCKVFVPRPVVVAPPQPAPLPPPPPVIKPIALDLDANGTFAFNKYAINDLKQEGKVKIDNLLNSVNISSISSVEIIGHTDRLGNEKSNKTLSQHRANTIKDYIVSNKHVNSNVVDAKGVGSAEPVVMCSQKNKAELINCLAPNRRISIKLKAESK